MFHCLVVGITLTVCAHAQRFGDAVEVYSWVSLDYDWPNDTMRADYVTSGKFTVQNNIITGIKVYGGDVYLTVPRWRPGVPSTLNRVIMKSGRSVLQPFPSWSMQTEGDCWALQYVQSMEIDPNTGLMWIIDTGRTNFLYPGAEAVNACPPKLVVYDINGQREVRRFIFPDSVANHTTCFLNDIVLDYVGGCVAYAYITDSRDAKLYVYDVRKNEAYFFSHPTMQTELPGGGTPIDGIAMSADFDYVYYCPISGLGLFQIPTAVLRERDSDFGLHVRRVGNRTSRADGLAYGQDNLYHGIVDTSGVGRWLVSRDAETSGFDHVMMTTEEVVVQDHARMLWVDTFGWDEAGYLWFTANNLVKFFSGGMSFTLTSGTNMYVWKVFVNKTSYLSQAVHHDNHRQCFPEPLVG